MSHTEFSPVSDSSERDRRALETETPGHCSTTVAKRPAESVQRQVSPYACCVREPAHARLQIVTALADSKLQMVVTGTLVHEADASLLRAAVSNWVRSGVTAIEVDLREVHQIDTAGIAALIFACTAAEAEEVDLSLARVPAFLLKAFARMAVEASSRMSSPSSSSATAHSQTPSPEDHHTNPSGRQSLPMSKSHV